MQTATIHAPRHQRPRQLRTIVGALLALPIALAVLASACAPTGADRYDLGGDADDFINPGEETLLFYLYEPEVEVNFLLEQVWADEGEVANVKEIHRNFYTDVIREEIIEQHEGQYEWNSETLHAYFDGDAGGDIHSLETSGATHVVHVKLKIEADVDPSGLPSRVYLENQKPAALELKIERFDGSELPLIYERSVDCRIGWLTSTDTRGVDCDLSWEFYDGFRELAAMVQEQPNFQRLSAGAGKPLFSSHDLHNSHFINDASTKTLGALYVPNVGVIDTESYDFGGEYEFEPVYLWMDLEEPTEIEEIRATFAGWDRPEFVSLLWTSLDTPEAPSPDSADWIKVSGGSLSDAGNTTSWFRGTITARHVAMHWVPEARDEDGTHGYGLVDFDALAPVERGGRDVDTKPFRRSTWTGGGGSCFVAGTLIATPSGEQPIETLRVGDEVLSYDTESRELVLRPITRLFETPDQENGELILEDGRTLHTTPDHPFFRIRSASSASDRRSYPEETDELEVVRADELQPGDELLVIGEHGLEHQRVASGRYDAPKTTVYNFTVDDTHAYFAEGVLVHNR